MRHFSVMIKPASSQCNLKCAYCFYHDISNQRSTYSYGHMSHDTMKSMLSNIFSDLEPSDSITFVFQGGEPLLAGINYFESFVKQVRCLQGNVDVDYTLQTNGTLLNKTWCEFLKKHDFLVGLSLDGFEKTHNEHRLDKEGKGTYHRVLKAKSLLDESLIEYNVVAVLTKALAEQPKKFWETIQTLKVPYIQIIPCLSNRSEETANTYSIKPRDFAYFYTRLFDYWKQDYDRNKFISIKLFDDILNLLVLQRCTACGMTGECSPQFVIEADGSTYPCDFYAFDEYKIGNMSNQTLLELLSSKEMKRFLMRSHTKMDMCEQCSYYAICKGGCERMHQDVCGSKDSVFCGYKRFLDRKLKDLTEIAKNLSAN